MDYCNVLRCELRRQLAMGMCCWIAKRTEYFVYFYRYFFNWEHKSITQFYHMLHEGAQWLEYTQPSPWQKHNEDGHARRSHHWNKLKRCHRMAWYRIKCADSERKPLLMLITVKQVAMILNIAVTDNRLQSMWLVLPLKGRN